MGYALEKDSVCMHHAGLRALKPQNSEPRGVRLGWSRILCELLVGVASFPIGLSPKTMQHLNSVQDLEFSLSSWFPHRFESEDHAIP